MNIFTTDQIVHVADQHHNQKWVKLEECEKLVAALKKIDELADGFKDGDDNTIEIMDVVFDALGGEK